MKAALIRCTANGTAKRNDDKKPAVILINKGKVESARVGSLSLKS